MVPLVSGPRYFSRERGNPWFLVQVLSLGEGGRGYPSQDQGRGTPSPWAGHPRTGYGVGGTLFAVTQKDFLVSLHCEVTHAEANLLLLCFTGRG